MPGTVYIDRISSTRFGPIWVAVTDQGLAAVDWDISQEVFSRSLVKRGFDPVWHDPARTAGAVQQICEYLEGRRRGFDLQIDWSGMPAFQKQVLEATLAVPYGRTCTYAEIARQVGRPLAARAVGRAEATNPMPLVIPCHRVVGSDGGLHGYGGPGGLQMKAWLLKMEKE